MNERTFQKRMLALRMELERATSAEPYDPDAYNNVVDEMNITTDQYYLSQKFKRWIGRVVFILLVLLLAWLIFCGVD